MTDHRDFVRVGFLGAGFIARYHAAMLERVVEPHVVAAVFDPVEHRRRRFAEATGAVAVGGEEALIEACDAVFVCTWTSEHPRLVAAAAEAGRAVFCEKPLAVGLDGAEAAAKAVDAAGVVNMCGLVLRSSPAFVALRAAAQDPAHGRIMSIVFRDDQFLPTQGMYRSDWRADRTRAGAGTLLEHSIHDLDVLTWIAGPVADVSARTSSFHGLDGIEDVASVVVAFESGATATLTSVWHDVLRRGSLRRVEVLCERAHLHLEGNVDGRLVIETDEAVAELDSAGIDRWLGERGLTPEIAEAAFLRAVATGGPSPRPTMAEALAAQRLADAAYRSAATGGAPQRP